MDYYNIVHKNVVIVLSYFNAYLEKHPLTESHYALNNITLLK